MARKGGMPMLSHAHVLELARLVGLLVARTGGRQAVMLAALRGARARLADARQDLELIEDHLDLIEEIAAPSPPAPPAIRPM